MSTFQQHRLVLAVVLLLASAFATEAASKIRERERRDDCPKLDESCDGTPRCCGTLNCYWKDGFSVTTNGVCVDCIQASQTCQADTQCCSTLVCQTDNMYQIDGKCDVQRPDGSDCYRGEQCVSGHCDISWYRKWFAYQGKCLSAK